MRRGGVSPSGRTDPYFVDSLDPVNADADAADGFVWRLRSEEGDATGIAVFGDSWLIISMSVWRDANALTAFMHQGRHRVVSAPRVNAPRSAPPSDPAPDD